MANSSFMVCRDVTLKRKKENFSKTSSEIKGLAKGGWGTWLCAFQYTQHCQHLPSRQFFVMVLLKNFQFANTKQKSFRLDFGPCVWWKFLRNFEWRNWTFLPHNVTLCCPLAAACTLESLFPHAQSPLIHYEAQDLEKFALSRWLIATI